MYRYSTNIKVYFMTVMVGFLIYSAAFLSKTSLPLHNPEKKFPFKMHLKHNLTVHAFESNELLHNILPSLPHIHPIFIHIHDYIIVSKQ